jgi:hypothetical protein
MNLLSRLKNAIARAFTLPRPRSDLHDLMHAMLREKIKAELDAAKRSLKNKIPKERDKAEQAMLLAVEEALARAFKTKDDNLFAATLVSFLMQSVVEPGLSRILDEVEGDVSAAVDTLYERICKALKI